MGRNPLGSWIQGPAGSADFSHPFTVFESGNTARVSKGLVFGSSDSFEPSIGRVPIGGDDKNPQPSLKLDPSLIDDLNQSWVVVQVTPDKNGKLDPKAANPQVVIAQHDHPFAMTGPIGCAPLALLFYKNSRWQVFQIAFFHFLYITSQPAKGPRQHFFL